MKTKIFFLLITTSLLFISCGDDEVVNPPQGTPENWDYPANGSKFAITLYSDKDTVTVGSEFDVKVIFYNIDSVFGAAFEIGFDTSKVKINEQKVGPHFTPSTYYLPPIMIIDTTSASFGITYQAGSNRQSSGSGAVMKLKCKAKAIGLAQFTINKQTLEIKKSNGAMIDNFNILQKENESIVVK